MHDIKYLAGVFDADGCVTIIRAKRGERTRFRLQVEVSNCYAPLLVEFKKRFGGTVACRTLISRRTRDSGEWGTRDTYSWIAGSATAKRFLDVVFPHLWIKRAEAAVALRLQKRISTTKKTAALSESEIARRNHLADLCSALKHRRYDLNGISSRVDLGRKQIRLRS